MFRSMKMKCDGRLRLIKIYRLIAVKHNWKKFCLCNYLMQITFQDKQLVLQCNHNWGLNLCKDGVCRNILWLFHSYKINMLDIEANCFIFKHTRHCKKIQYFNFTDFSTVIKPLLLMETISTICQHISISTYFFNPRGAQRIAHSIKLDMISFSTSWFYQKPPWSGPRDFMSSVVFRCITTALYQTQVNCYICVWTF